MREPDVLLNSLVNVERTVLLAVLTAEAQTATKRAMEARERTPQQRRKRLQAMEQAARLRRILAFFTDATIAPEMSENDIQLCKSLERRLRDRQAQPPQLAAARAKADDQS